MKYILIVFIFLACSRAKVNQYPKVVKSGCAYAVRIDHSWYKDKLIRDTFEYIGFRRKDHGFIISGYGYSHMSDDDSVVIQYKILQAGYKNSVWITSDTVYNAFNGDEIQFKDSVSADAALQSYLWKTKRDKFLSDSFDNLISKRRETIKAFTDSVTKCHTYK